MKLRDSGMPDEAYWESLFDVPLVLARLGIDARLQDVAEFGCGYGTFTIPIARAIKGSIHTFDIEPDMVSRTCQRALEAGLKNVICRQRDVMEHGFDVPGPVDAALLFNILHCDDPGRLIEHAAAIVRPSGAVLAIHWTSNRATPRGPNLDIRPKPQQIVRWAETGRQVAWTGETLDLPPWHFGVAFTRLSANRT
jgi:SAM-dependent methyltransferase